MKYYALQILNDKNIVLKEQLAKPTQPDFYDRLFGSVGFIEVDIIIQFRLRPQLRDGVREVEHRLSNATGRHEWEERVNIIELYEGLSLRQKQLLLVLAEYSNEEAMRITGFSKYYLNDLRKDIYGRIDVEGRKQHHNQNYLKEFCKRLVAAGVELIAWSPDMK